MLIKKLPLLFVFITCFISTITHAKQQSVFVLYDEFKKIKHLNSFDNVKIFRTILTEIESEEFEGLRAPFYGYGAKLANQDGNLITASRLLNNTIESLPHLKNDDLLIDTLDYLSTIYFYLGDYANAIFYVQEMMEYTFRTKNSRGHNIALNRLALNYLELGLYELATPVLNTSLKIARDTDNKNSELLGLLYLVNVHLEKPQYQPNVAMGLIEMAEDISSSLNINDGYIERLKGIIFQKSKDYDQAMQWLTTSLNIAKRNNDVRLLRIVHRNIAELYLEVGQTTNAKKHALLSLDFAIKLDHQNNIASLNLILSKIHQLDGETHKALNHLKRYTDFITSDINKNVIGLLTMMNKQIDNTAQQKKIITLENSVLAAQLKTQKAHNKQYKTFMTIIAVIIIFIILTIIYFIRIRILSMKVALSMKDSLTGAYGRSYLPHYLPAATARLLRTRNKGISFGVIAIDCDDFKLINEQFGHAGGDRALKAIVVTLKKQIRANDYLFRWGGDEFVLMCEDISIRQLTQIAQRLTHSVNNLSIDYDDSVITPTISVGYVLHRTGDDFDLGKLLKRADKLLYKSKDAGKNNAIGEDNDNEWVDNI